MLKQMPEVCGILFHNTEIPLSTFKIYWNRIMKTAASDPVRVGMQVIDQLNLETPDSIIDEGLKSSFYKLK